MATPMDLIDTATEVMTYAGIADAETACGSEDWPMQWCGALSVLTSHLVEDARQREREADVTLLGRLSAAPALHR